MFSYLAYIIKHLFNKQPLQFEKKKKKRNFTGKYIESQYKINLRSLAVR